MAYPAVALVGKILDHGCLIEVRLDPFVRNDPLNLAVREDTKEVCTRASCTPCQG